MANPAKITGVVTITVKDINNNSVAKTFNDVITLSFDFFNGKVNIVDTDQGSFYFSILLITTVTYTINGTTSTLVMT